MAIRISRNEAGNCINFIGSTQPAYWNACLSAVVNAADSSRVDIINDIRSANEAETAYEFYAVDFSDFADRDGTVFTSAEEMVNYVNANANVQGVSAVGTDLTGQSVDFRLDQTSTSVIMDNGSHYGVNTIKAVADTDGTIHLHAIGAGVPNGADEPDEHKYFEGLDHTMVRINEQPVSGGINDVVNALNELFTVGAFESVVISDPYSTMIADVGGTLITGNIVGAHGIDPIGDDVFGSSANGNYNGYKSTETIDQAGEYFTFDIRNEGQIGFGLVHSDASYAAGHYTGTAAYADPSSFGVGNSAHYGFQFSHWFHPTPNGSWTNYGANTSYVQGPAWYSANTQFEARDEWLAGDPIKIRVGLDENGFIAIWSLADDGTTWKLHARTGYPVPQGAEFHLGVKVANSVPRLYSTPKVHLLEPAAPTMQFRYIESPDDTFVWPLFATAEEAEYYDEIVNSAATPASHTHTYADDPTNTTWYMPEATHDAATYHHTAAPSGETFNGQAVTYTEITSLTNADLAPPAYSQTDISQEEGTAVNLQIAPAGSTWTSSVTISPSGSGLVFDGYSLIQGTLADVGADTDYTITVVRANAYGSSTGSMTLTATNVAPTTSHTTTWTKALDFDGSSERAQQVDSSSNRVPMKMSGINNNVAAPTVAGNTSSDSNSRPWATAIVFKATTYNSNQHVWNVGEGSGTTDDNIYLRRDANRDLWFGWGRAGEINECYIGSIAGNIGGWWAVYIASTGERVGGGHTAADIADCFDIRFTGASSSWAVGTNKSTAANWTSGSFGYRMNREFTGDMTIGGRGANRSFRGKIASFVATTLRQGVAMPTDAEIAEMITDPKDWLTNYKVGNAFRLPWQGSDAGWNFSLNDGSSAYSTQVWLMGDGTNDSYSNMIRNQVHPSDQNYTKLNMISMVSNDIETVTISGLT